MVGLLGFAFALPALFVGGVAAVTALLAGVFSFAAGVVLVFYFAFFEAGAGTSIGKRLFGLAVRSETGRNLNFLEALAMNLSKIYWILLLLYITIGFATSKEYTQKFSDRFVGTSVVKSQA